MVTKWSQNQSAYHADVATDPGGNAYINKLAADHCNRSDFAFDGMGPTCAIRASQPAATSFRRPSVCRTLLYEVGFPIVTLVGDGIAP